MPTRTEKTDLATEVALARLFDRIDAATKAEQRAHQLAERIVRERAPVEGIEAALAAAADTRAVAVEARGLRVQMESEALELRGRREREANLFASRERASRASKAAAQLRRPDDAALREAIERRRDAYLSRRQLQDALWGEGLKFGSDRFVKACNDLGVLKKPQPKNTKVPRT